MDSGLIFGMASAPDRGEFSTRRKPFGQLGPRG
ncbi:MAG: hypothetical protein JWO29_1833 [Arthrobacter sp.]|nr:hypothetical protein [Arthrobacter sp.]